MRLGIQPPFVECWNEACMLVEAVGDKDARRIILGIIYVTKYIVINSTEPYYAIRLGYH